jgi:uncharacterized protein (DUF1015 family)
MPDIQAFRGLRYNLGQVGSLSDVVAPPYDVIDPELQNALYKRHPSNVIRLILNRDEPGDDNSSNRYTRAARFLRNWRSEGVLQQEGDPAIYVYHQLFEVDGEKRVRRGFMARVRLEPFGEGKIYPHEETHASAKEDRLKLTRACRTNLSQIFGIYPDPENDAFELLDQATSGQTPLEAVDHLGVIHRIWPITDVRTIGAFSSLVAERALFIADGHHRYETALNYRNELIQQQGTLDPGHPANFVLTMLVSMSDPGMVVLPTHRLFRGLPPMESQDLKQKLESCFETRLAGEGADLAESLWQQIEMDDDQGQIALYCGADQRWILARLNDAGRTKMAEVAADHCESWQGLGVALLHRLIIESLLGATNLPKAKYVHRVDELVASLQQGDEDQGGSDFPLAALVMPATLDHIRTISEAGERMPAKSTYFYPKLLSGLVLHPLE